MRRLWKCAQDRQAHEEVARKETGSRASDGSSDKAQRRDHEQQLEDDQSSPAPKRVSSVHCHFGQDLVIQPFLLAREGVRVDSVHGRVANHVSTERHVAP